MAGPKYDPNELVTRRMFDEAVDAILKGIESMFKDVTRSLNELKVGQSHHKDQIDGLKADLSDTPSRREFQELKTKVDKHHPLLR